MHHHLQALHRALVEEQRAEADEHARLAALAEAEQVAAGFAWPLLQLVSSDRLGKRHRLVLRAPKGAVLHDGIGAGDPVWIEGRPGTCDGVDGDHAEILVDRRLEEVRAYLVTRRHDPATFIRYRQALERAAEVASPLRARLLGEEVAADARHGDRGGGDPTWALGLDAAQGRAARHALDAPELAVVHGPPGTGKTRMLAAVLAALVARGERPWALADSNAAVDHLACQAARAGLSVVRLGHVSRIGSEAAPLSLAARILASQFGPALAVLDRELSRAREGHELRRLLAERRALRDQARQHVLDTAEVLASTFGTLARLAPELPPPTTAVVDEATQATEPAVWVAVPFARRLVLVGDPEQLGPVSRVPGSPLERSLLQRLVEEAQVELPMLEVQHRMASPIRELVAEIYGADYRDHPTVAEQQLLDLPRAVWVDTAGAGLGEAMDPTTRSLYNDGEAVLVARAASDLRGRGVAPDRIGVITPYSAQVARLTREPALAGVEVATVNAFQGREKDAILVSWVRSNEEGELGFVADARRLTVALTRARAFLWQVGDSATLARHPRFAALVERHDQRGDLQTVWEPPWADVLAARD
ncbi:MAG: AAA domain-containing protein [Polyangiaceae bacterium]